MPIPGTPGTPDYTYKTGTGWIPIVFAGKTLEKFYAKTTVANITTTDYIGELKRQGDTVVIRTTPSITIKDYKRGQTLDIEFPEAPSIELTVNRAKYFNFAMDDIDQAMTDINWLDKYADDAAQQMKIVIDREFFEDIVSYPDPANVGTSAGKETGLYNLGAPGSPITLNRDNVLDFIVDCGTVLDEQNCPDEDRWIVLPPAVFNLINKSDLRDASFSGDSKSLILRGGFTGKMLDRFAIYESNLLFKVPDENAFYIPFGRRGSLVYAAILEKTERYRPESTFADAMKGLLVYDWACIYPAHLGMGYVTVAP